MAIRIKQKFDLSRLTTFRIGGKSEYFVDVNNRAELKEAVAFAQTNNIPIFILGGGSDVLISDKGFSGLVIRYSEKTLAFKDKDKHVLVSASAGLNWDEMVERCVERGLQGIECLSGIPGTVGASPIQNIGAYGQELSDTFYQLTAYDLKLKKFIIFDKKKCRFSYRESIFKNQRHKGRYIIVGVKLKLNKNRDPQLNYESLINYIHDKGIERPKLIDVRRGVLELRKIKLEDPEKIANAGSFFKNPVISPDLYRELKVRHSDIPVFKQSDGSYKLYAGWLVEKSGWRGKTYKGAKVSDKHALVLTNPSGKATARQIKTLAKKISDDVFKKYGIRLEPEVRYIGFKKLI